MALCESLLSLVEEFRKGGTNSLDVIGQAVLCWHVELIHVIKITIDVVRRSDSS